MSRCTEMITRPTDGSHVRCDRPAGHTDGCRHDPEWGQFLIDVFCTAVEGGITYWAEIRRYHWTNDPKGNPLDHPDVDGFYAIVREEDEEDDLRIDREVIERGVQRILSGDNVVGQWLLDAVQAAADNYDAGEIDADGADAIVQAGLFGEIVYG